MKQIKLQYCRAASIILIFSPFKATHDTQMTFKCTTFSSVFCFEEKISMRTFSCLLQVDILWIVTQISVWSKPLKHPNFTSSWCSEHFPFPHEEPPRWWQGGEGDRAGTAVTAPSGQSLWLQVSLQNSVLVTHLAFNKALLWLFLSSCFYNLWILSQPWPRVYFPTLTLVLNFADQTVLTQN